jgi:hypothetical protein
MTSSKKTDLFRSSKHNTSIQGFLHHAETREDNIVYVEDIVGHVLDGYSENKLIHDNPKFNGCDWKKHARACTSSSSYKAGREGWTSPILIGVMDGHLGTLASAFVANTVPYELVALPEFQRGDYEQALTKLFAQLQQSLIASPSYNVEGSIPYASGTTASFALVTKEWTYFASLGDSPIIACDQKSAFQLIKSHNKNNQDCIRRILASGIPLADSAEALPAPMSSALKGGRRELALPAVDAIGAGLSIFGSLGDVWSDPRVYNLFVRTMQRFAKDVRSSYGARDSDRKSHHRTLERYSSEGVLPNKFIEYFSKCYENGDFKRDGINDEFICQVIGVPNAMQYEFYKFLLHRVCFPDPGPTGPTGPAAIVASMQILSDPIIREPIVKTMKNSHLKGFMITSDGMIAPQSESVRLPEMERLFDQRSGFDRCFTEFCNLTGVCDTDDRSGFLCWFGSIAPIIPLREREAKDDRDHRPSRRDSERGTHGSKHSSERSHKDREKHKTRSKTPPKKNRRH